MERLVQHAQSSERGVPTNLKVIYTLASNVYKNLLEFKEEYLSHIERSRVELDGIIQEVVLMKKILENTTPPK